MKIIHPVYGLFAFLLLLSAPGWAQCTSGCPSGSLTTLPTGASGAIITIPAGTTYCIAGPVSSGAQYVINGTLVIASGVVTLGSVILNTTGVVDVESGSQLIVTSNFSGSATGPAATFSNINICSRGFLNLEGVFNQGEVNAALASNAVLLVQASWSSTASDVFVDMGAGALIEVCAAVSIIKSGFITETSSSVSYLFIDGSAYFGGWISTSMAGSLVDWTILGSEAGAEYVATHSCINCGNLALAPTGASTAGCGITAGNYVNTILPVSLLDFYETTQGEDLLLSADLASGGQVRQVVLESSVDGSHFYPDGVVPAQSNAGQDVHYVFTVPGMEANFFYRLKLDQEGDSAFSWVLPPMKVSDSALLVFPNPASTVLYIRLPTVDNFRTATLLDGAGNPIRQASLPSSPGGLVTFELPPGLSSGMYLLRLGGAAVSPKIVKVMIVTP